MYKVMSCRPGYRSFITVSVFTILVFLLLLIFPVWHDHDGHQLLLQLKLIEKSLGCNRSPKIQQATTQNSSVIWDKPNVSKDDPELVSVVRQTFIPPTVAKTNLSELNYMKAGFNPSAGQVQLIEHILRSFGRDGFFIECGANDGEWYSNTLWVERTLGWKRLLIEADPIAFQKLIKKNRNAWLANQCLATLKTPKQLPFFQNGGAMGSLIEARKHHFRVPVKGQCVNLYTILLAINRTTIDFFSLDIEGSELDVLKTIPFDKVFIKVLTVDHILIKEGKHALKKFMESHSYKFFAHFEHPKGLAGDSIFIHSSIHYNSSSENIRDEMP